MSNRISEPELILPSLHLMKVSGGSITTSELIDKLRSIMKPSGEDLAGLSGRQDDKFSQKVRNLNAHDTFERTGYAQYEKIGVRNNEVKITAKGEAYLIDNQEVLNYLLTNDFAYDDVKENLRKLGEDGRKKLVFDENILIEEGIKKISRVNLYERSARLRDYAIEYFTKNDRIACQCCSFDFEDFYGKKLGGGYIEIHHNKPIFQYEGVDIQKTLKTAVQNLTPVCANCHRMIHRKRLEPLEITDLTSVINQHRAQKLASI